MGEVSTSSVVVRFCRRGRPGPSERGDAGPSSRGERTGGQRTSSHIGRQHTQTVVRDTGIVVEVTDCSPHPPGRPPVIDIRPDRRRRLALGTRQNLPSPGDREHRSADAVHRAVVTLSRPALSRDETGWPCRPAPPRCARWAREGAVPTGRGRPRCRFGLGHAGERLRRPCVRQCGPGGGVSRVPRTGSGPVSPGYRQAPVASELASGPASMRLMTSVHAAAPPWPRSADRPRDRSDRSDRGKTAWCWVGGRGGWWCAGRGRRAGAWVRAAQQ